MEEKVKDFRLYAAIFMIIALFLNWASVSSSASVGGVSADASSGSVGHFVLLHSGIFGIIVLLMIIATVAAVFIPQNVFNPKVIYLLSSLVGLLFTLIIFFRFSSIVSAGSDAAGKVAGAAGVKAESSMKPGIGFILHVLCFLFVLLYTIIKDFAINKETLKQEGLKGTLQMVAGQVQQETAGLSAGSLANAAGNLSNAAGALTNAVSGAVSNAATKQCPSCGASVLAGKKFCAKCGHKFEDVAGGQPSRANGSAGMKVYAETMTVKQYISTLKSVKCESCGETVNTSQKFCPNCGSEIVIKAEPLKCEKCGEPLFKGKKYCGECGTAVVKKTLVTECPGCKADVLFGKKFCVECGAKIE